MGGGPVIELADGDIFDADVEAIICPVSTFGIAGKGLALEFKRRFPRNFDAYAKVCLSGQLEVGSLFVFDLGKSRRPHHIINFPIKRHWRERSRIEDIGAGLEVLNGLICLRGIRSIAVPAIGCSLGSLVWSSVLPLIEHHLGNLKGVRVVVYGPKKGPSNV